MEKLIKKSQILLGQSLFEVILAIAVISIVLVTLVSVSILSLRNANYSKNKTGASRIAQETNEWLRTQRDESWDNFSAKILSSPVWCMPNLDWNQIGACQDGDNVVGTIFTRELRLISLSATDIQAETKVYWSDAQGFHDVKVVTILTDWRSIE